MKTRPNQTYQAIVAAPGFTLGVLCDEDEITGIDFLEPRPEIAASTPLAAEAVRQLRAYLADTSQAWEMDAVGHYALKTTTRRVCAQDMLLADMQAAG